MALRWGGFGWALFDTVCSPWRQAGGGPAAGHFFLLQLGAPAENVTKKKATAGIAALRVPKCLRRLPGRETNSLRSNMFPDKPRQTPETFGSATCRGTSTSTATSKATAAATSKTASTSKVAAPARSRTESSVAAPATSRTESSVAAPARSRTASKVAAPILQKQPQPHPLSFCVLLTPHPAVST